MFLGLVSMVAQLTLAKEQVEKSSIEDIQTKSEAHQLTLLSLVDEDARSFTRLMEAYKMPRIREEEKRVRAEEMQRRLMTATDVPLKTAEVATAVIELASQLSKSANMNAISDLQTAIYVGYASAQGALANVNINLAQIKDEKYCAEMQSKISAIQTEVKRQKSQALDTIEARVKS